MSIDIIRDELTGINDLYDLVPQNNVKLTIHNNTNKEKSIAQNQRFVRVINHAPYI
jgi:hypothetical protein